MIAVSSQTLVQLAANDYVTLQSRYTSATGGVMESSASLFVVKMDGLTGPAGPSGSGAAFPYTGSATISGSLIVTGSVMSNSGFTGSLLGTSSQASTASYIITAQTASYVLQAVSSSFSSTASYVTGSIYTSTNLALSSSFAISSSRAISASWAPSTPFPFAGNAVITGSLWVSGAAGLSGITSSFITGSLTGELIGTASWATRSISASFLPVATYFITSSWAQSASNAVNAQTASFLSLGTYSITSSWAQSASNAVQASTSSFSSNTFTNLKTIRLELGVSSTTAITTGAKGRKPVSFNGTIIGWRLVADQSTTTTVDIWKANGAIPTVANTITAAAKPALTAAQLAGSTTLTGWTTSIADGDVFILNVDSNNNATYICLELDIVLTNA
jgi:hypothetical protein